jgi:hypothetical protein
MLKQKHANAKKIYAATVRSTWGLKERKSRKYFYNFFNAGIGK